MDISNNLDRNNFGIKNGVTNFYTNKKTNISEKEITERSNSYSNIDDFFISESREEFLKKLKSKNSLAFFTQLLTQNDRFLAKKSLFKANDAYVKSNKISDLIYGNIEYTHFFA